MLKQRRKPNRVRGFTLIELLTVVAIIGLLVSMVVPTIRAVLENNQRMKMLVRVQSLDAGATVYKMSATGNRYYPGQDAEGLGALTGGNSSRYPNCANAGSALLARCLFTDPNGAFPVSAYGTLDEGLLDTTDDPITDVPRSILDSASETMAILYYPSRMSEKGSREQYKVANNSKYTAPSGRPAPVAKNQGGAVITIQTYVQSSTNMPVRMDGEFVISAAGTDGLYFSTSAVDNFNK